jgi:hypothetical protein
MIKYDISHLAFAIFCDISWCVLQRLIALTKSKNALPFIQDVDVSKGDTFHGHLAMDVT